MSNVLTGVLASLVVVLALALWYKEQEVKQNQPRRLERLPAGDGSTERKSKAKKSKKKSDKAIKNGGASDNAREGNGASPTASSEPLHDTSSATLSKGSDAPAKLNGQGLKHKPIASHAAVANGGAPKEGDADHPGAVPEALDKETVRGNGLPEQKGVIDLADLAEYEIIESKPSRDEQATGWQNVGGKARVRQTPAVHVQKQAPANAWASSNPFAALPDASGEDSNRTTRVMSLALSNAPKATSQGTNRAPQSSGTASLANAPTKRQRQNAARAQSRKADKDAQEAERLQRLAQHKRQLHSERARAADKPNTSTVSSVNVNPSKAANGGPRASINERGSLVWD